MLSSPMLTCRVCATDAGFVKSHIIPEAFFRELRDGQVAPLLIAGAKGQLPKKVPIGVYDREMLCATCEAKFLQWDTYGTETLLTRFDDYFGPLVNSGTTVAYESANVDKLQLLDFLVSVLWRASVSTQFFYNTVNLGPHEGTVLDTMLAHAERAPETFDAVLSRWKDENDDTLPTSGLMNPHREKWGDVNAYRLYLGKIVAYVRVDQRPFARPFADFSLRAPGPCRVINRSLATSKDLGVMRETAVAASRNAQDIRRRRGT
jgi:hypothetical protein